MTLVFNFLFQFLLSLAFVLSSVLVFFYSERKGSAFIQDRLGPTHVGKFGLLQPAADLLKLLHKETIIPANSRKFLFIVAPVLIFASVFTGFALIPLWPEFTGFSAVPGGLLLVFGLISLDAIAILMASYASQSKFPMIATGRAVAQMVSYEVPLGISILCFFWIANSVELSVLQSAQIESISTISSALGWPLSLIPFDVRSLGGIFGWNIFQFPILLFLLPGFYLSILAESNRAPFDIPEGESEIIGGFHTEYSGFMWAIFFLAEYAIMLILALIMSYLFFGGAGSPIGANGWSQEVSQPSFFWLLLKSWLICLSMIWVRWTLPRLRVDQLMSLSWKILTPVSLLIFLICILFK